MQTIIVTICLGLLLWVEPASAKEYLLSVRVHKDLHPLRNSDVVSILQRASMRLMTDGKCDVQFKLKNQEDPIATFDSGPSVIKDAQGLELVHQVPADVKVVQAIEFCIGTPPFTGCSFRSDPSLPKTMIVRRDRPPISNARPLLWAHEFGHTTGLNHRLDQKGNQLMTPCGIKTFNSRLTPDECSCFLAGPKDPRNPGSALPQCSQPDTLPMCPPNQRR